MVPQSELRLPERQDRRVAPQSVRRLESDASSSTMFSYAVPQLQSATDRFDGTVQVELSDEQLASSEASKFRRLDKLQRSSRARAKESPRAPNIRLDSSRRVEEMAIPSGAQLFAIEGSRSEIESALRRLTSSSAEITWFHPDEDRTVEVPDAVAPEQESLDDAMDLGRAERTASVRQTDAEPASTDAHNGKQTTLRLLLVVTRADPSDE